MTHLGVFAGATVVGAFVALAAFGVVHHQFMPVYALIAGVVAGVIAAVARLPWSPLPLYVGVWLDLGVVVALALIAAGAHAVSLGPGFVVLKGPELVLLFGSAALLGVATTGLAYTHLRLANEVAVQQRRMAELERAALQSRLSVLSAQINPHFLFNTLNTLAEVVHEDEDAAEDLVADLSAMMRSALRGSTGLVPLADELMVVRRLLRIESARLGDRLQWTIVGEDQLSAVEVQIPGLTIQPLVENAVKYAVAARAKGGRVDVHIEMHDDHVMVRISDDGPGLPDDVAAELERGDLSVRGTEENGGGLRNCVERLRLTWPDGGARVHHDRDPPGTTLIVELPLTDPPLPGGTP
ncbi:MAG: sensor histidine kinase [Myxococcota bacterium]